MAVNVDREDGVISQIQQSGRLGFPAFGPHPRKPNPSRGAASPGPRAHAESRRILFIEDDTLIADMYRMKLESEGWNVEVASDGEAGVRQALADPPDLVLLDILLPRLDGIEVLRLLRAEMATRSVPVLILSNAVGLGGREEEAQGLGIVDWVVKANVTPSGLATRVARILAD
jgi:DNA-binding response OmpR family regulator